MVMLLDRFVSIKFDDLPGQMHSDNPDSASSYCEPLTGSQNLASSWMAVECFPSV